MIVNIDLFQYQKPGPLGQVREDWQCRESGCQQDGMMEYRNDGILGVADCDLFLYGWHGPENKIRP